MKYLAFPVMLFSLCLAQENAPETESATTPTAQTTPPTEEQAAAETTAETDPDLALTEEAKPHLEIAKQHISLLRELGKLLGKVTDTESADAAAAEVVALAQQVKTAMEAEKKLPEPSQEVQYLVTAETATYDLEELTNLSIGRAIELQESEPACHGSAALEQALNGLLSLYLQDEEEPPATHMAE